MIDRKFSRRDILLAGAGLGALGAVMSGGGASAMSEQKLQAGSELGLAYANRCNSADAGAHTQLVADLQSQLMKQPGSKGEVLSRTAVCPICGCPVTATRTVL